MALYAIDGTWNTPRNGEEEVRNTNVMQFCRRYEGGTFYEPGVGTKLGFFGKLSGGAFGIGGDSRVDRLYRNVCHTWVHGDREIEIIGFSRGAALALDLANTLFRKGIRHPESSEKVAAEPPIRFMGLWDTVGSFGLTLGPFQKVNLGHHLGLPKSVLHCFHALALDERRTNFAPTRLGDRAYEVWFRGNHSDVGGGNGNTGLNNISLLWMLRKALAVGLPVTESKFPQETDLDFDAELNEPLDPVPTRHRKIADTDCIHYSVRVRPGGRFNNPGEQCAIEDASLEGERLLLERAGTRT
jgi:uncharacterized protein (DUF2235 family)